MPFLRHGIVSSVLPYDYPSPHGFTIDVMSQGGASGSPIFLTDQPRVIGILHAGFPGTNFTYAVPARWISDALKQVTSNPPDLAGVPTIGAQIARAREEGTGPFELEPL
jgi:hypothetical protein